MSRNIRAHRPRRSRRHYNVQWTWAMMDELVDLRRNRNDAYHNTNGRSRHEFWDTVAARFICLISIISLRKNFKFKLTNPFN